MERALSIMCKKIICIIVLVMFASMLSACSNKTELTNESIIVSSTEKVEESGEVQSSLPSDVIESSYDVSSAESERSSVGTTSVSNSSSTKSGSSSSTISQEKIESEKQALLKEIEDLKE
jgi:hypothetical protein